MSPSLGTIRNAVAGAARYFVQSAGEDGRPSSWGIMMATVDETSCIDTAPTRAAAVKKADRWQKRENESVRAIARESAKRNCRRSV